MYYLVDTKTQKPIVKSEDKAELKRLIKRLYTYQHWSIVEISSKPPYSTH